MQLVQVRQYLMQQLPAMKDNDSLIKGIPRHHAVALNLLRAKALVIADATRGLKVLESGKLLGFMNANANSIVAFRRHGTYVTVADYYRERGEPLAYPTLPVLSVGEGNKAHRDYFPLEKVYLHKCGRPCNCISPEGTTFRPIATVPPMPRKQHPSPPASEDETPTSGRRVANNRRCYRCRGKGHLANACTVDKHPCNITSETDDPSPPSSEDESTVTIVHKPRAVSPLNEHAKQQRVLERIARIIVDSGAVKLPSVSATPPAQKPEDLRRLLQCSFAESMLKANTGMKTPKTRSANANFSKIPSAVAERNRRCKSSSTDHEIKVLLQRFIDESDQEREDESSNDEPRAGCSHD
ncbi:hypothetical protein AAVH_29852 [Aphelenchoides avenae]|nr:hypothetical protein AAVH_29852 [Aphelenchus avenae]